MDREARRAPIHGPTKSQTWLGSWTELSLSLFQQIFLTQEFNQGLLHCRQILYQLSTEALSTTYCHTPVFFKKKVKRTQQRPSLTQCPLKPLSRLFVFSFMEKKNLLWYLIIPGVSESSAHILFWIYENQSFTLILTYYIEDVHPKVTIWSLLSNPMVNSIHISLNSQHNLIELRNPSFSKFPHRVSWLPVYMSYTSSVRFIPRYWLAYAILKAF